MLNMYPAKLILVGFVLVLFGFIGPFLMILGIVETSFTFSILSYFSSVIGLFLGLIGTAMYTNVRKK
ncbi:MAG TPA: hypothetical protein ENN19_03710 [Chloroflexi bacterium]|nr:hypothetical protein [Chloroflexota bacterium]